MDLHNTKECDLCHGEGRIAPYMIMEWPCAMWYGPEEFRGVPFSRVVKLPGGEAWLIKQADMLGKCPAKWAIEAFIKNQREQI